MAAFNKSRKFYLHLSTSFFAILCSLSGLGGIDKILPVYHCIMDDILAVGLFFKFCQPPVGCRTGRNWIPIGP